MKAMSTKVKVYTTGAMIVLSLVTLIAATTVTALAVPESVPVVGEAIRAAQMAGELAEHVPTDIVKLAWQVAILAIIALLVAITMLFRLAMKQAEKAWLVDEDKALAILREMFFKAYREGMSKGKQG